MPENENFVSRWSRRKHQVIEEESTQHSTESDIVVATEEIIDPEQLKAEKLELLNELSDEDMPDIETLNEKSDFSMFMSTSVSEGLRRMALRKLFQGKSYNIRDGLDEYDGDYTVFEKLPKNTITADMKHMVEVEAKRKLAKEQEKERHRQLAAGEIEEDTFEDIDEFDEFEDEDDDLLLVDSTTDEYVDEYINVEGFDTTAGEKLSSFDENDNNNNEDEEVA